MATLEIRLKTGFLTHFNSKIQFITEKHIKRLKITVLTFFEHAQ